MNLSATLNSYFHSKSYQRVKHIRPQYVEKIDHCAFRSINRYQYVQIEKELFDNHFVKQKDSYSFPEIKTIAEWYKNTNSYPIPRVFSSLYIGPEIKENQIETYQRYQDLLKENHYLAWTLIHPFNLNHIGFDVKNIQDVYMDLKKEGFEMNGDIQVSSDKDLFQFSLKADKINHLFADGWGPVYGSFIEFIERKNQREGFHTQNASKIFDSTK